jgi:hypothetical protein
MHCGDLQDLLVSEEPGEAKVEMPLRVEVEDGKELIRDKDGRPQGVVERRFANVSLDCPRAAA